ncbi:outer membrane protein assembly factor BamE [Bdellovibrio bacteriovorus]|uniref:outer membrane protein assembly factor BamE n=1 Tax=Bdellovibrio bacteriovorus TaxID=959 RepID=UPI0035A62145
MLRYLAIPVVIISLLTTACQTSMLKQFGEVKPGMEKDDVLDLMGSPSRTQRYHGKDRWTYVFYDDRIRFEKEVQFFNGNAIYVGDISQPEVTKTAMAVDAINDQKNKEIDEQIAKEVEQHRKEYSDYEAKARGEDKVRYVPEFESIR